MSKEKKKSKKGTWLGMICFMLIGMACGIAMVRYIEKAFSEDKPLGDILFMVALLFVGMYVAMFIQIAVHEAGHLVCGLLTGYRFSSYRVGSFMWLKEDGKIKLKRFSLAGTGGQCLMIPPDMIDGKVPYVLYNLGGSLTNLILSMLAFVGYLCCEKDSVTAILFLILLVVGIGFALMNGIPMRLGGVDNDGKNAWVLGKDSEALYSFWVQMKVNEQNARGVRLKDMPEEWFRFPSEEGLKNHMAVVLGSLLYNRQMDMHDFDKARETMTRLLDEDTALMDLHRSLMKMDGIYLELIGENDSQRIVEIFDKELKKSIKTMKRLPSVVRTEYAYALLFEKDMEKAQAAKEQFEKIARTYPYACDIESERELMEIASEKTRRR